MQLLTTGTNRGLQERLGISAVRLLDVRERAAHDLAQAYPEIILYGCTSGSFLAGIGREAEVAQRIADLTKIPSVTTSTAVVAGLRALKARKRRPMFMADLARQIDLPVEFDFMAVSSYGAATKTSGVVRIVKDLDLDLSNRDVLVVEDIIDSGLTLQYLLRTLKARDPEGADAASGALQCMRQTQPLARRCLPDLVTRAARTFDRQGHAPDNLLAIRVHLDAMVRVARAGIALDGGINPCTARTRWPFRSRT